MAQGTSVHALSVERSIQRLGVREHAHDGGVQTDTHSSISKATEIIAVCS